VIDYYLRIAPVMLPHLPSRPVTIKRYPEGVDGESFYQKKRHEALTCGSSLILSYGGHIRGTRPEERIHCLAAAVVVAAHQVGVGGEHGLDGVAEQLRLMTLASTTKDHLTVLRTLGGRRNRRVLHLTLTTFQNAGDQP
jgi:hypothetical protein